MILPGTVLFAAVQSGMIILKWVNNCGSRYVHKNFQEKEKKSQSVKQNLNPL